MTPAVRALLSTCLLAIAASAEARSAWSVRAWRSDDGLPNNYVTGLAQTPDGYLWVATFSRPARFDGVRFEEYPLRDFAGGPNQKITALQLSRSGGLWMGTVHGQVVFLNSKVAQPFTNGLPDKVVQTMIEDQDGALWISYPRGTVCRIKDGVAKLFTEQDGLPASGTVCSLARDSRGQLWFAKDGRVGLVRDGRFETLLQLGKVTVRLAAARDGGIWICSGAQLLKYDGGKIPHDHGFFQPAQSPTEPTVLFEDHKGGVWIGTLDRGLFHYDETGFETVTMSDPMISSLAEDREGNIWVGTGNGGLNRVSPRVIELESPESGLPSGTVQSMCEETNGGLWATTFSGLLLHRPNETWSTVSNWPGSRATCVAADRNGAVWIGTRDRALHRLRDGVYTTWRGVDGLAGREIHALLADKNGDVWIGEEKPDVVQRLRDGRLETFAMPPNVRIIRAMAEDIEGNIWIGTSGGMLLRIRDGAVIDETVRTAGAPFSIRALHATPDGGLWIGYADEGVGWLKDGHFARLGSEQGFPEDNVSQIIADDQGWLWFGGDHGIFKVQQQELEQLAAGRGTQMDYIRYGQSEGLFSLAANCGDSPGALRSRDGRLWMPMRTALAIIHPKPSGEELEPSPVILRRVAVDDHTAAMYGGAVPVQNGIDLRNQNTALRLPPGHRRLEFEFTALSFGAPENVRFRYLLEGLDVDWTEAGTRRNASYSRLPAGNYRFLVKACNSRGVWNEQGAALAFAVAPFVWQTWWFRLGTLALFTSITALLVRSVSLRRIRMKLSFLEQQAALDKERARIARDIHDDLGSYLTEIVMLSEFALQDNAEPEKMNRHLRDAVATARQGIQSLDETVWAVNPRNDTLPHLVNYIGQFTVKFLQRTHIRANIDLPDNPPDWTVPADVRHNLFLVVKEALNNVARHASATEVRLTVIAEKESLGLTIEDNGRGFGEAREDDSADGLRNMRQRAAEIGGQCRIESKPGAGTKVSVSFPWRRQFESPARADPAVLAGIENQLR